MIRAAMIGLGWWGRHMVKSIEGSEKLTVNRLAARSVDKHRGFAEETGIELLDSYEKCLADPDVDAVVLCTPHSQHEDQVLAAVEAGKQIFCEKPFALSANSTSLGWLSQVRVVQPVSSHPYRATYGLKSMFPRLR